MSHWVLTTLGTKKYPIFINPEVKDYEPSKTDVTVNSTTFEKNRHRLVNVQHKIGTSYPVYAFKEYVS